MNKARRETSSPFGYFSIRQVEAERADSDEHGKEHYEYIYRPAQCLWKQASPHLEVPINCHIDADGLRRFVPQGYGAYIPLAFEVGLAALEREALIKREVLFGAAQRRSFRVMFHIFQLVRRMQEHQERNFDSAADLSVRISGRGGEIGATVFPDDLCLDPGRYDLPLSTDRLIQTGYALAAGAGEVRPSEQVAIHTGLVAAASLRPMDVQSDQVEGLVRRALFDFESTSVPDPQFLECVTERLLTMINAHLPEPQEKFDKWFFPGKGNLIKAIADKARSPGGKLQHAEVRQAVLHLGWQSYGWMANCLDAFGRWFQLALPETLKQAERLNFEQMFLSQPEWGNLPLVLLMERGKFMRSLLIEHWDNPSDPKVIRTAHRMLHIYAEMSAKRQKADLRFKGILKKRQEATGKKRRNGKVLTESDAESPNSARIADSPFFDKIAQTIADFYDLECPNCLASWTMRVDRFEPSVVATIELELACNCGRTYKPISIPAEEFRRLVGPLVENNRDGLRMHH